MADYKRVASKLTSALVKAEREADAAMAAEKAADESSKMAKMLESKTPPMTTPSGTGLPLLPRSAGMYPKDVPQVDLPRQQGRGGKFTPRMQDLIDSRSAKRKTDELIDKGGLMGMKEWYGTEPLRQAAMDVISPEQYDQFMAQLASASQRNPVDQQNKMGSYLWHLSQTGQLPDNAYLLTNKIRKNPSLAPEGTPIALPEGYGSLAQGDIFSRGKRIASGDIEGALPPDAKLGTFYRNLQGNLKPVTVDVNAVRGPVITHGDPRWLTSKLVEKDENGNILNSYKPREMLDTGEMTLREAKQRPGFWEAAPSGSEYAGFEKLWTDAAKRAGVSPAEAQAMGWYGSADVTALKTKPELYIENLERMIRRTAEESGQNPTTVLDRVLKGEDYLKKDGGAIHMREGGPDMEYHSDPAVRMTGASNTQNINGNEMKSGVLGLLSRLGNTDVSAGIQGSELHHADKSVDARHQFYGEVGQNLGDSRLSARVMKAPDSDMYQGSLMARAPLGEGNVNLGVHGSRMNGQNQVNAYTAGYDRQVGPGHLNIGVTHTPQNKQTSAMANYRMPFKNGGRISLKGGGKVGLGKELVQAIAKVVAHHHPKGVIMGKLELASTHPLKMAKGGSVYRLKPPGFDEGGSSRTSRVINRLAEMAKEQAKEEFNSLGKPRAATDLLNRGVVANTLGAPVDLMNMGLQGAEWAAQKATGKPIRFTSDTPVGGSEWLKDKMNEYNVTSGEERPMMETGLSLVSPSGLMKSFTSAGKAGKLASSVNEAKTVTAGTPTGAKYVTAQEGPFYRVRPTSLESSEAQTRGVREASGPYTQGSVGQGSSATGQRVPKLHSDEEVAGLINSPNNVPLNIANKYTKERRGTDFALPNLPTSSLAKQSAIGRTHLAAVEGSPEYKKAVFDAYGQQMPDVLDQAGAKNYDDLMEKAYRQLAKETSDQFEALPVNTSFHRNGEGNYNGAREMAGDVHGNKHLYVFQGGDPHDFLNGVDPHTGLNENEKFRAVHDLFGHAIYGNEFGPAGEEKAWGIHQQMYSPLARLAMTAETRGQNSVVNFTPLNAQLKSEVAKLRELQIEAKRRGDTQGYNIATEGIKDAFNGFQYAPQKAVLLPPEYLDVNYKGGMPDYVRKLITPQKGTESQSVLTHFSHDPNLTMTDPTKYGSGIKGAEMERLQGTDNPVVPRTYFYAGEPGSVAPEPGLGVNRYRAESPALYDINEDPLALKMLARESNRVPHTAKYNAGVTHPEQNMTDVERMIREYGYEGYLNKAGTKPAAVVYEPKEVVRQKQGGLAGASHYR
jgi:hypothetical protein